MTIEDSFFGFAATGGHEKWYNKLDQLASLALPENWQYRNPDPAKPNQRTPILENYIVHTFKRLAFEYNSSDEDSKNTIFCRSDDTLCFNTGLYTHQYESIYAMMRENRTKNREPWYLIGFADTSDPFFSDIPNLPRRASYFRDIKDLIFDTNAELRINSAHILRNPDNLKRLPESIRDNKNLSVLFNGAVDLAKKKVEANYKAAVPQFYNNQICFLLPICLLNPAQADVSLAVRWHNGYYTGHTCLSLDMAYNNARLIACPNSEWLMP